MASLVSPLTVEQDALVRTVWHVLVDKGGFPKFRYVDYAMRIRGLDAQEVLRSFPTTEADYQARYGAAGFDHRSAFIDTTSEVWLTVAALHHLALAGDEMAQQVADVLLACMRAATDTQELILQDPFGTEVVAADLAEILDGLQVPAEVVDLALAVADREWPGLRTQNGPDGKVAKIYPGTLLDADFRTTGEYLEAVMAAAAPKTAPAPLPYTDPRALVRAFTVLDITVELVVGTKGFVARPPMDRSALLTADVDDADGFQAGLAVLAEVLRDLAVPGKNPSHALGRLTDWLADDAVLPGIDRAAVERAVKTLDSIRELRNNAIHPKPSAELLDAHGELGLPFPIDDHVQAWDSIRAHAERALTALYEEILAARR